MKKMILPVLIMWVINVHQGTGKPALSNREGRIAEKYDQLSTSSDKPSYEAFYKAIKGYLHLDQSKLLANKKYLTLIDFSLSSNRERLWIIDMEDLTIVHHTFVSHGRNTGDEYATSFSNIPGTYQSSLGFYVTGDTYFGKHGLSLYLDGMEEEFNGNARSRAIVMHSADYATSDFIGKSGRLGRSFGCPAIPPHQHKEIIELIKGGTVMFIYYPDQNYLQKSKYLL